MPIRAHHFAAVVGDGRDPFQRRARREDAHPLADRDRVDEEAQLVDEAVLDQRGDEGRAAVDE